MKSTTLIVACVIDSVPVRVNVMRLTRADVVSSQLARPAAVVGCKPTVQGLVVAAHCHASRRRLQAC